MNIQDKKVQKVLLPKFKILTAPTARILYSPADLSISISGYREMRTGMSAAKQHSNLDGSALVEVW